MGDCNERPTVDGTAATKPVVMLTNNPTEATSIDEGGTRAPQTSALKPQPHHITSEETGEKKRQAQTDITIISASQDQMRKNTSSPSIIVAPSSKMKKFVYDPAKIALRFLFANRDGLSVILNCDPSDTVGEVKGALLSVWPKELPDCCGGENVRLICMGKGMLMPDTRSLQECQVPSFKTHPTPINVSVKPIQLGESNRRVDPSTPVTGSSHRNLIDTDFPGDAEASLLDRNSGNINATGQGCACVIL